MTDLSWASVVNSEKAFHDRRKLTIGSSDIPIILGISPFKTPLELWKIKVGAVEPEEQNFAQSRGTQMEPVARDWLNKQGMGEFFPKSFAHPEMPHFTASLDAYCEESQAAVEIKFSGKINHELAKLKEVPPYYLAQIHWQYIVANPSKIYYLSYQEVDPVILEVERPSEERKIELITAAAVFLEHVKNRTQPPLDKRDFLEITEEAAVRLASDYEYIHSIIEQNEKRLKAIRERLVEFAKAQPHPKIKLGSTSIAKAASGNYIVRIGGKE